MPHAHAALDPGRRTARRPGYEADKWLRSTTRPLPPPMQGPDEAFSSVQRRRGESLRTIIQWQQTSTDA